MIERRLYLLSLVLAGSAAFLGPGIVTDAQAQTTVIHQSSLTWHPSLVHYHRVHPGTRRHWAPGKHLLGNEIRRIRALAQKAAEVTGPAPSEWVLSAVDPSKIVAAFPPLRVKKGFVLRGYECGWGLNSSGSVVVMPANAPYPGQNGEAIDYLGFDGPAGHLGDVMQAVEGDGSPWSYLCASVLSRELGEFGARWHGQHWVTHTILTANPWKAPAIRQWYNQFGGPSPQLDLWEWLEPVPDDWRPRVSLANGKTVVTFYTHGALGQEAIYRHVDTYKQKSYCFTTQKTAIAKGPRYMVF